MGLFRKKQPEPRVGEWVVRGFLTDKVTDEARAAADQLYSRLVAGIGQSSQGQRNLAWQPASGRRQRPQQ
jgi:hypothetical protein